MTTRESPLEENSGLQLIKQLYGVVSYHQTIGIDPYFADSSLEQFFSASPIIPGNVTRRTENLHQLPEKGRFVGGEKDVIDQESDLYQKEHGKKVCLEEGPPDISHCMACDMHKFRSGTMWGRRLSEGSGKIRLMLIGDWFHDGKCENDTVFGAAEDEMIKKMISAIKLSAELVYLTNAIKCCLRSTIQPGREHLRKCSEYLQSEIAEIQPEFICAMGPEAARAVLPSLKNLAFARNRVHQYRLGDRNVPVIVTYHPHYLLKNSEMKRPTWLDLQMLAKYMGLL